MIDTNIFQDKTAVYYTLGCKLNFSETSTIGKILREAGVRTARKGLTAINVAKIVLKDVTITGQDGAKLECDGVGEVEK